jgi:hypothetical protein
MWKSVVCDASGGSVVRRACGHGDARKATTSMEVEDEELKGGGHGGFGGRG